MIALDRAWLAANPLPPCDVATEKNARGRLLVAGGSEHVPGALRLTGEAALRTGAGKVQLATVERAALAGEGAEIALLLDAAMLAVVQRAIDRTARLNKRSADSFQPIGIP